MNIEDLNKAQLTSLIKGCVAGHESNKVLNPLYADPKFKGYVSQYDSKMKVETSSKRYDRGLMITETDCGVYGLYLTSQWHGEENIGTQPVVKFKEIEKLYCDQVMTDLYNYLQR